jgi:hypothetical protein
VVGVGVLAFESKETEHSAREQGERGETVRSSLVYSASAATLSSKQIAANSRSGGGQIGVGAVPRAGRRGAGVGGDVRSEPVQSNG